MSSTLNDMDEIEKGMRRQQSIFRFWLRTLAIAMTLVCETGCVRNGPKVPNGNAFAMVRRNENDALRELISRDRNIFKQVNEASGHYLIHYAVSCNNLTSLRIIIENGADIDMPNAYSFHPLHIAATHGQLEAVQILLDSGADALAVTGTRRTALHIAAESGHQEVVSVLVKRRVGLDGVDDFGATAIDYLAMNGNVDGCKGLVANGARKTLLACIALGEFEQVQKALEATPDLVQKRYKFNQTMLHVAARSARNEIVSLLLKHGADRYAKCDNGSMAIHLACESADLATVRLLADRVSANAKLPNLGSTPLHFAVNSGNSKIVADLLSLGANPNTADLQGLTPLWLAARQGSFEIASALVRGGADVNTRSETTLETPLHLAVSAERDELALFLIRAGANIGARNRQGATPIELAKPISRSMLMSEGR